MCDRIGKETGKGTKSRRKTETAAVCENVYLGKVIDLWNQTKCTAGIISDIEFAKCLLDRLVLCYFSPSTIFTLF